jgi:alkylation response protein AidB-like acyl-CoA dehydrogenase
VMTGETDDSIAAIRATVDALARRSDLRSRGQAADREACFDPRTWDALVEAHLPGLLVPEEFGGQNAGVEVYAAVIEQLAHASIAASTYLFTHAGFASSLLADLDTDHPLRAALLPGVATGDVRFALAVTEPTGGSDLSSLRTQLSGEADSRTLRGEKAFTTLAGSATHLLVAALDESMPSDLRWSQRLTLVVVPMDAHGVERNRMRTEVLRSAPTYSVHLDDVPVDAEWTIPAGKASAVLRNILGVERIAVASQSIGLARAAREEAIQYARNRLVGEQRLLDRQAISHALVDVTEQAHAAELVVADAARAVDRKEVRATTLATMAQRLAASAAHKTADVAVQIHGGHAFLTDSIVQQLWRDTRLHLIGPVARESSADWLADRLLAAQ